MKEIEVTDLITDVTDLIDTVNRIEEKKLNAVWRWRNENN